MQAGDNRISDRRFAARPKLHGNYIRYFYRLLVGEAVLGWACRACVKKHSTSSYISISPLLKYYE